MENILQPWVSWSFLQNNYRNCQMIVVYLIYIHLLLFYNRSILDIEHSPYYIALGSTHTHKVI